MASPIDLTLLDDDVDREPCPVCTELIPVAQLAAHCESHFSSSQPDLSPVDSGTVVCATCGASIALAELDSHLLAHELQGDLQQAGEAELDQLSSREAEELYFKELRAKYGFEDAVRVAAAAWKGAANSPGPCFQFKAVAVSSCLPLCSAGAAWRLPHLRHSRPLGAR
jgi:hypothetical protein